MNSPASITITPVLVADLTWGILDNGTEATQAWYSVRSPLAPRYSFVATEKVCKVADCTNEQAAIRPP